MAVLLRFAGPAALLVSAAPTSLPAQECREGEAPGSVVRGTVVDSATRVPLRGADVRVTWPGADGRERAYQLETGAGGRFRLCRLPAATVLSLRADYHDAGRVLQLRVSAGDSAEVELEAGAVPSELRGTVARADDGEPLAGVEVSLRGTPLRAVTDPGGGFEFARLPPGSYQVRTAHPGYGTRVDSVEVDFRATVQLRVRLAPAAVKLPPLVVDVRSHVLANAGFYERRDRSPGAFLTRRQWASRLPSRSTDLLRVVPGVRVQYTRQGFGSVVLDRRGCAVRYFLDGVRTNPTFQLDEVPVDWIEALEIYRGPAEVPPQFVGFSGSERATCGVVVIWTRAGSSR